MFRGKVVGFEQLIATTIFLTTVKGFMFANSSSSSTKPTQIYTTTNKVTVALVPPTVYGSNNTNTYKPTLVPVTIHGPAGTSTQSVCKDEIDNCSQYGRTPCTQKIYEAWTKAHCAMYCGYCTPLVPLPTLCEDRIHNCAEYDSGDLCTDPSFYSWAYDNCKGYCKYDMCNESWCEDSKGANCALLDSALALCADKAKAKTICRKYCGLCDMVDGHWCSWGTWSACDASCGNGTEVRTRQCTCPSPSSDGLDCVGESQNSQECTKEPCPVDGGWSSWTDWSDCSVSCGIGMRKRKRLCNNPYPSRFGNHCFGENVNYDVCAKGACSDGNWTTWSQWTKCSQTCGYGVRSRNRTCITQNLFLQTCSGQSYDYEDCFSSSCTSVNGGWATWTSWSVCDHTSCSKQRTRSCTNPSPTGYGRSCSGNSIDKKNCDLTFCSFFPLRIRLRGGSSSHRGRVEVSMDGSNWGTVCDDSFTDNAAKVVCRMLGYPTSNARADTSVTDGPSSMPIYLDDIVCTGQEASLLLCNHRRWLEENCSHSEDVGVICE